MYIEIGYKFIIGISNQTKPHQLDLYESLNMSAALSFASCAHQFLMTVLSPCVNGEKHRDEFNIPRRIARKLRLIYGLCNQSSLISLSYIPRPLLFLLRYNSEQDLEYRVQFLRDLMLSPSVFVLRVLEWLIYYWVEDIGFNSAFTHGLEKLASTLGML